MARKKVRDAWQNRIVRYGMRAPDAFSFHEDNFRIHPDIQKAAMAGVLDTIGWISDVIVNVQTGNLIDGHLRVWLARKRGEKEIPFKEVDLSPDEERLALTTFDPLTALADVHERKYADLVRQVETDNAGIRQMLDYLADTAKVNQQTADLVTKDMGADMPTLEAETLVQIFCSKEQFKKYRGVLDTWREEDGVTVYFT